MELMIVGIVFFLLGAGAVFCLWRKKEQTEEYRLRELERSLALQREQFEEQNRRLEQMAQLRHDFRHHVAALQGLTRSGDLQAVESYLDDIAPQRSELPVRMCANAVVNALAQHYLGAAGADGVAVDAELEIGEDVGIRPADLSVVFGNCLENAAEAARQTGAGRTPIIRIRTMDAPGWVSIVMENSCPPGSLQAGEKGYFSSKEQGRIGVGLASIRSISEQYGGTATYEMADGLFRTAVILFKRDEIT